MKYQPKLLAVLTSAALLAGCGSSGGSGGGTSAGPAEDPALQPLRPGYEPSPCGRLYGYPVPCVSRFPRFPGDPEPNQTAPLPVFKSWSDPSTSIGVGARAFGITFESNYAATSDGLITPISVYSHEGSSAALVASGQGEISAMFGAAPVPLYRYNDIPDLRAVGQPGIQVAVHSNSGPNTPYASIATHHIGFVANPHVLGWNYQSFGIWDDTSITGPSRIGGMAFGAATPSSAIPTTGAATFSGKLAGLYVSPAGEGSVATADLALQANFSTRSLSFSSSGTITTRDLKTATPAPHLNLGGTLTYSAGGNLFSGTLTNAGGTMTGQSKGQFHGPAAQELGGIFTVQSKTTAETFTGAYGAKR